MANMDMSSILPVLLSDTQKTQNNNQGAPAAGTNGTGQDFNSTLRLMIMDQVLAMLGSANNNDNPMLGLLDANTSVSGNLLSTMPLLAEQLLSQKIQLTGQDGLSGLPGQDELASLISSLGNYGQAAGTSLQSAANLHHINQFTAAMAEGGSGMNSDCGPTSLVMALHQIGLGVAGASAGTGDGKNIDLARLSMANNPAKDGINARGKRDNAEHTTYTDFDDLGRGAAAAGAKSERITPDAAHIARALQSGASVVASGTFAGKYPLPWTGDRGFDNNSAPGNAAAHIIEVSAYDPQSNSFIIHDPARRQYNQVSAAQLERFMSGNAGAIAIRR